MRDMRTYAYRDMKGLFMKHHHLLGLSAMAIALLTSSGCVATTRDGYYANSSYGDSRPADIVYVRADHHSDQRYRDRERQARQHERERQQHARDEERRRARERQARERSHRPFGGISQHEQECAAARQQNASGSDTVLTPSRPCR